MQLVPVTMAIPKESKEVVDVVVSVLTHFLAGGDLAGAAAKLPLLMEAVAGFNEIGEEIKSEQNDELAGYALRELMQALKTKKVVVPPQA
jgi:hypothetical protein